MDIYVLDGLNGIVDLVDAYVSLIWNMQYYGTSEFEMVVAGTKQNLSKLAQGRLLVREIDIDGDTFKNVMLIEKTTVRFDSESGWLITASGRGLKSLVGRRIVWEQENLSGSVEDNIRQIITDNVISPSVPNRAMPGIELGATIGGTETAELQARGENLAEWLAETCKTYDLGWDIDIRNGKYVFYLYRGTDRSYAQSENPVVVFSPEYDNLVESTYSYDKTTYANAALVGGEGEGIDQRVAIIGNARGMERYETYIDGDSVSSNGEIITPIQYIKLLEEYGKTELSQIATTTTFEGEVAYQGVFKLNEDFFLGDIVQVENELGIEASPRVIEVIYSEDASGVSIVPTFTEWEVEE